MKNILYSLCLLIGFSSQAQTFDYQINKPNTNLNQKVYSVTTNYLSNLFFSVNEELIEEEDEAFDFDIKKYLPVNFNPFLGLFSDYEIAQIEEDEAFDFDTTAYLPIGFNANATYLAEITEISIEEEDEVFDFDTAAYLPVGFDANETYLAEITDIAVEEEDEPFDFNTAEYLPVGFNVYPILEEIVEIELIEEDEPFDFKTEDYLPNNFDPHATEDYTKIMYDVLCIASQSI